VIEGANDPAVSGKISQMMINVAVRPATPGQLSSPHFNRTKINPNGSFQTQGLAPGKVWIELIPTAELRGLTLLRIERDGVPQPRDGIEIGGGEQVSNLRLVAALGTLSLRGEVQIVGGTLPQDLWLGVFAQRGEGRSAAGQYGEVDPRGLFVIEHLSPGEYELRLSFRNMQPGPQKWDQQLVRKISQVRQKVVVSGDNQQPVIIKVDLGQEEGNR
jgi:hypothetical protein